MLIKLADATVETDKIALVDSEGDGTITLHLQGGERVTCRATLGELAGLVKLVMLDSERGVPVSAIAALRKRENGFASIMTMTGTVFHTQQSHDSLVAELL